MVKKKNIFKKLSSFQCLTNQTEKQIMAKSFPLNKDYFKNVYERALYISSIPMYYLQCQGQFVTGIDCCGANCPWLQMCKY